MGCPQSLLSKTRITLMYLGCSKKLYKVVLCHPKAKEWTQIKVYKETNTISIYHIVTLLSSLFGQQYA